MKRPIVLGLISISILLFMTAIVPPQVERSVNQSSWDQLARLHPPELCPPDVEPEERPIFGAIENVRIEGRQVVQGVAQTGLVSNKEGELFVMEVTGMRAEAVRKYANEVRVCLDYLSTPELPKLNKDEQQTKVPSKKGQVGIRAFGSNSADLIIEVYLLGFGEPEKNQDLIKLLLSTPVQEWESVLKEFEVHPQLRRGQEIERGYVIDMVIDPSIARSARHQYQEKQGTRAKADISVDAGSGSVTAGICRNGGVPVSSTTVSTAGTVSATISHNAGVNSTYDLGVKGVNTSNRYRVSSRIGWVGWNAGLFASAPAGSAANCNP